jgi:peptide/nickel transport system permease protein
MIKRKTNIAFNTGIALAFLVAGICAAGFFLPSDYNTMNSGQRFKAPGREYLMGTDNFGRDVFFRVMAGAKYTLLTAVLTVAGSAALGSVLGMFSGYAGGIFDEIIMRLMDTLASFPGILLALVMVSLMGNSQGSLVIALLMLFIPGFTRIMRNGILQLKGRDFILAARITGVSDPRIIFVHIFPNLVPSFLSASVLGLSNAILAESTMSYLGLGIQPPAPSWGRMLSESQAFLFNAPWAALTPGLMIVLTVLAFHYLGEGLRKRSF